MAGEIGIWDQSDSKLDTYLPRIAAEDPTLIFYADFRFGSGYGQPPVGWFTNNGGSYRFYVNHFGTAALTTEHLIVGDETSGGYAYGNKTFTTGVTNGTLEFDFEVNYNTVGSVIKEQNVIMKDASGITNVFQMKISYDDSLQEVTLTLESTTVTTKYQPGQAYHVKIIFANSLLTMYVDGIQELSGVTYGGETIQEIYIESTVASYRGYTCFDNIEVRSSSPVPEPDLFDISSIPDDDGIIDLDWSDVPLSTYKVFRDRQEIYKVDHLTPIATPSASAYQDTTGEQGTFWYAIVATNASGDSVPSISKHVRVDYGEPAASWTPILDTITPNPNTSGDVSLTWDVPTWPKIYNATDQFTGGTISPFTQSSASNTNITSVSDVGPFAKAIKMNDGNAAEAADSHRTFPAQSKGTVEFWVYFTRTDRLLIIELYDLAMSQAGLCMIFDVDAKVYVWNSQTRNSTSLFNYTIWTPYRIRIDYDDITKKSNVTVNDLPIANNYDYWHLTAGSMRNLCLISQYHETGQEVYVAYPGYTSVTPYLPGDNALGRANVTNYKVYRNTSQITDVSGLTPIATVTENYYTDHVTTSGTYWYAIVATNETNSPISNSESVVVDVSDVYENGQLFTLDPGAHQVTILETDGTTILMEFSITVLTTMEMSVTVTPANPASASLLHALRFFIIDVKSGTYAPSLQVKFHYSDAGLTDAQEGAMGVYYLGPVKWDNVGGTVYKSENCVYITLNHFSTYAVAWVEGENGLPDMVIWVITIGAGVIIIIAIFKLRGGKKGGSGPQDGFEDLFDTFDEV